MMFWDTFGGLSIVFGLSLFVCWVVFAGGFAEVTGERCTVLAEEAMPVEDIDPSEAETRIASAHEALDDADNELARAQAEAALAVGEAMAAIRGTNA